MTTEEAIAALTEVLSRQLNALGTAALSRPSAALAETPKTLARAAVEWCETMGVSFELVPSA